MKYIFQAKDQDGKLKKGFVETISREEAISIIQKSNLIPVSVKQEEKIPKIIKDLQNIWEGVSQQELVVFYRQLATLVEARVPLIPSLKAIEDQSDNKYLKIISTDIIQDIEGGMTFSDGMAKYPYAFSALSVNIVKAGEISGNLQKSLTYIAENTEKNYQLTSKIKSALFYPGFVLSMAFIIGFVVVTWILPKLTGVIKELDIEVPWYTHIVINFGDIMNKYWYVAVIVMIAIVAGIVYYLKTEEGKREWDRMKLKIPVLGKMFKTIYMSRFSEYFSVLLLGGIPVVKGLLLVSDTIGNSVYESILLHCVDEVKTGGNISTVFGKYPSNVPPILTRMVKIGEETGKMSEILKKIGKFYEEEIDRQTKTLASLIEPILIVFLGIGVAILVFSVLLPVYNIAGQIK